MAGVLHLNLGGKKEEEKQLVLIKCKTKAPEISLPADLLINSNLM